jgi:Meckel syndrome type 1 protein
MPRGTASDAPAEIAARRAAAASPPALAAPDLTAPLSADRAPEILLAAPDSMAAPEPRPAAPEPAGLPVQPAPAPPAASAPEPPTPARPPAPVPWPARQVAPFAVALALGPDASINLTLEPGELGRVEVAIERNGTEALVSLRAERPETLALLQRDRAELERALADAGLGGGEGRGTTLSFGLGGEGANGRERRGGTPGTPRRAVAEPATTMTIPPATARGLLDLAI